MKRYDCEQYSQEYWGFRRGVPTASEFHKIITPKTMAPSASAEKYICRLIGDKFDLLYPRTGPTSADMRRGLELEPESRNWASFELGHDIEQVGFITTDDGRLGASPDGLIPAIRRGIEFKNPAPEQHVEWLLDRDDNGKVRLPFDHRIQCHGSMIVAEGEFDGWYFCSYCAGLEPILIEVLPDEFTAKLRKALDEFTDRYADTLFKFTTRAA